MSYIKIFMMVALLSPMTYADEPGPLGDEIAVSSPSPSPTNHYGTGQQYANAGCPTAQTTLPPSVLSKSARIKQQASDIKTKMQLAVDQIDDIEENDQFKTCKKAVSEVIRKACGNGDKAKGEAGVSFYEDYMRSGADNTSGFYISKNFSYFETYRVIAQSYLSEYNPDRVYASVMPDIILTHDSKPRNSCHDYARAGGGIVDPQICFSTEGTDAGVENNCKACLRPRGWSKKGFYAANLEKVFNAEQDLAKLEEAYKYALSQAECVNTHIDNAPPSGPSEVAYEQCMKAAGAKTAADYCLYCDEAGQAPKKPFLDLNRWGPSLLTGGLLGLGGLLAWNQVQKTRKYNSEAGYPTDARGPAVLATYVAAGIPMVVNTLTAAGAFGCATAADGQVISSGIQNSIGSIFGGGLTTQTGGALGYPPGYIGGQATLSGGAYSNNPVAGPWTGANLNGSIEAQREYLRQQQEQLERMRQQSIQQASDLDAMAQLSAQINAVNRQSAELTQQANIINARLASYGQQSAGGAYTDQFGRVQTGAGLGLPGALLQGGLRIGVTAEGFAGANGNAGLIQSGQVPQRTAGNWNNSAHYGPNNYDYFNSGAPGVGYPPVQPRYTGPGQQRLPNYSNSSGGGSIPSSDLGGLIPSLGR